VPTLKSGEETASSGSRVVRLMRDFIVIDEVYVKREEYGMKKGREKEEGRKKEKEAAMSDLM